MLTQQPQCKALNQQGVEYNRPAQTVEELDSHDERIRILIKATQCISDLIGQPAFRRIPFGAPTYTVFGFTLRQAKEHTQSDLLLKKGCEIPLSIINKGV